MTRTRHLLLIADLRHASPRWPTLAGGLIAEGWRVTVVTPPIGLGASEALGFSRTFSSGARIVECGPAQDLFEPLRRLLWALGLARGKSLTGQLRSQLPVRGHATKRIVDILFHSFEAALGWPDVYSRWKRPAVRKALQLIAAEPFTVVLSSSPYPSSHAVAAAVKRRHPSLRWVADFRDLWSQNHNYAFPRWRQMIDAMWERRMLASADALLTPSDTWAQILRTAHGKPTAVIRNSFIDYEEADASAPPARTPLVVAYTGVRYPGQQKVAPVLEAFAALQRRGFTANDIRLEIVGPHDFDLEEQATMLGVLPFVSQRGPVSRRAAQRAQREAHVLLYLEWEDPSVDMVSALKFWEYLGTQRPMLLAGGRENGSAARIAMQVGSGVVARTADAIAAALIGWIDALRLNGHIPSYIDYGQLAHHGTRAALPTLEKMLLSESLH